MDVATEELGGERRIAVINLVYWWRNRPIERRTKIHPWDRRVLSSGAWRDDFLKSRARDKPRLTPHYSLTSNLSYCSATVPVRRV